MTEEIEDDELELKEKSAVKDRSISAARRRKKARVQSEESDQSIQRVKSNSAKRLDFGSKPAKSDTNQPDPSYHT